MISTEELPHFISGLKLVKTVMMEDLPKYRGMMMFLDVIIERLEEDLKYEKFCNRQVQQN